MDRSGATDKGESMNRALITGVTGQDGAYLAKFLLDKGYVVIGGHRRASSDTCWRLRDLRIHGHTGLHLVPFDITDADSCRRLVDAAQPTEIYNLAAQSFVGASFTQPNATSQSTGVGALNMLEAVVRVSPKARFYQASSSELFGKAVESPQNEQTSFHPRSPYGVAKLYAHWMTSVYREAYGLFACCGILFNHESPLRGREFVTRKITTSLGDILMGKAQSMELGNLNARRDWGHAADYVRGMWAMLQAPQPRDYVLATGVQHTVREFLAEAAAFAGMELKFEGTGAKEIATDRDGKVRVTVNPKFFRPAEVDTLLGDSTRAREELGWKPEISFLDLCREMTAVDRRRATLGELY
jgi:GDPmannose 4,6-dehydratase